jgi:hypothetical protein
MERESHLINQSRSEKDDTQIKHPAWPPRASAITGSSSRGQIRIASGEIPKTK